MSGLAAASLRRPACLRRWRAQHAKVHRSATSFRHPCAASALRAITAANRETASAPADRGDPRTVSVLPGSLAADCGVRAAAAAWITGTGVASQLARETPPFLSPGGRRRSDHDPGGGGQ